MYGMYITNQPTTAKNALVTGAAVSSIPYVVAASSRPGRAGPAAIASSPDTCSPPLTCFSNDQCDPEAPDRGQHGFKKSPEASRRPLTTWHLGATFSPSDTPLVETATVRRYRWTKIGPLRFRHPRGLSAPSRGGETRTGVTSLCPTPLLQVGQRAIESDDVENPRAEDLERRERGRTREDSHRGGARVYHVGGGACDSINPKGIRDRHFLKRYDRRQLYIFSPRLVYRPLQN